MKFHLFAACAGFLFSIAQAQAAMPDLQLLSAADMPQGCACEFGRDPGKTLLYWPWEDGKTAFIKDAGGVHKLRMFAEKYFPERRYPPKVGDHQALMFSDGTWHIQAAGEVSQVCAAKAKVCAGALLRNRLVVQWEGREKTEINGWGRCGCSNK